VTGIALIGDLWNDPRRLVAISESNGTTARYVDVNPASTQILGYSRDEFMAMRPGDLVEHPHDVAPLLAELAENRSIRLTVKLRHKDGHLVTAPIRVHRARVATRDLNITISEPIV
jgi:PAS domain S-box-containing protein